MGCDYYQGTFLVIVYQDKDGIEQEKIVELDRVGRYYGNIYDIDFMMPQDYFEQIKRGYPVKDLYKDDKWFCLESRITEYEPHIRTIDNLKKLLRVYKSTDFWER